MLPSSIHSVTSATAFPYSYFLSHPKWLWVRVCVPVSDAEMVWDAVCVLVMLWFCDFVSMSESESNHELQLCEA